MKNIWKKFVAFIDSRKEPERFVLLGVAILLIGYGWFIGVHELMMGKVADMDRGIVLAKGQIGEQGAEQASIRATYSDDPNSYSRNRQRELSEANVAANNRLTQLYGQLIDPRQMSLMLTQILQRETALTLISLENVPSVSLLTTTVRADSGIAGEAPVNLEVYRHGLRMEFEGSFMETVSYLRSLEELENNFFWDKLEFEIGEYPKARISLEIYTLSTDRRWIGV